MQGYMSEVSKIQRKVYMEVARLAFKGRLAEEVDALPKLLTKGGLTNYRCCEFKERAVLAERIRLAMGFKPAGDTEERLSVLAVEAGAQLTIRQPGQAPSAPQPNVVEVIDIACDRCPIEKIVVTDGCRNCVGHSCRNACPKDAIYIIHDRAFVDQSKCVECGRCVKACPFNAILHLERPCERSCAVHAISPGESHNAVIDRSKCVGCSACASGCPFGAISPSAQIVHVVNMLKSPEVYTVAMLAPSFAGQFGPTVGPERVQAGLLAIGFDAVVEVAAGAEVVADEEAEEYVHRMEAGDAFMTTSCCPSFKDLIHTQFPDLGKSVSGTVSPMLKTADMLKTTPERFGLHTERTLACVFLGPCHAKKREAAMPESLVDAVLTFEEVAAMFVAKDVNLAALEGASGLADAGHEGRIFGKQGGPTHAITSALEGTGNATSVKGLQASGLTECMACLSTAAKGSPDFNLLEGMACGGGCVGGPATMVNPLVADRALTRFADAPGRRV